MSGALANDSSSLIWWDWVDRNRDQIWERTLEHLQLTAWAVGIGLVIALALSLVALRFRRSYGPITWVTGFFYTVPSLALFAFLVPYIGLGFRTALVALVSYTLLILVRNIVAGIDGVPAAVKEAADGMGYRPWRRFLEVDLRLATPTIVAGIRIATVTVIGLVTVGALVGAGGLGTYILEGLRRSFYTPIMVGAGLSIVLAVALDLALVGVERAVTPWVRRGRGA
ncbi:MAG TPA: ABC transporter permease [Acidimicrobiales bacterium]|nr:ABC transporter permease [Acidimicrobiales bacterium]